MISSQGSGSRSWQLCCPWLVFARSWTDKIVRSRYVCLRRGGNFSFVLDGCEFLWEVLVFSHRCLWCLAFCLGTILSWKINSLLLLASFVSCFATFWGIEICEGPFCCGGSLSRRGSCSSIGVVVVVTSRLIIATSWLRAWFISIGAQCSRGFGSAIYFLIESMLRYVSFIAVGPNEVTYDCNDFNTRCLPG